MASHDGGGEARKRSPVGKALKMLLAVADAATPMKVTEVAEAAGVLPSTASRALRDLAEQGWVTRDEAGGFVLGPMMRRLTGAATGKFLSLINAAALPLAAAADELGTMVNLQVMNPHGSQIVAVAKPPRYGNLLSHEWDVLPLHRSAGGVALISALPAARQEWAAQRLGVAEGAEIADEFRRHVAQAAEAGFIFLSGTVEELINVVAVPVRLASGEPIASIAAVAINIDLVLAAAETVAKQLHETADQIALALIEAEHHGAEAAT